MKLKLRALTWNEQTFKNSDLRPLPCASCHLFTPCHLPVLGIVVGARTRGTLDLPLPWRPQSLQCGGGEGERAQVLALVCPAGPKFPWRLTLAIIPSVTALVPKVRSHGQAPGGGLASCSLLAPPPTPPLMWALLSLSHLLPPPPPL